MCALIFEYGIATLSWYAEFALRRRVNMSAIGSVIVMAYRPSLATVSLSDLWRGHGHLRQVPGGYYTGCKGRPPWPFSTVRGAEHALYQLDLVMPGSSPRCAISRKQTRHRPNFR
ncbi:hypothetical protein GCM10009678_39310 [Actinomadura kijaniata]